MWLPQAIRLQTLGIWLQESSAPYMRRQYEPKALIKYMADVTKQQPNSRRLRCLRLIQGLDYLLCLRGLMQVNFWDYDRWLAEKQKKNIRDWTFAMDVNNAVQRGKRVIGKVQSQLRNLTPLVAEYSPNDEEWLALENLISVSSDQPQPPDGQVPLQPNFICIDNDDDEEEDECGSSDGDDSDDNNHDNDDHGENENDPDPGVDEDFGQYDNGVLSPSPSLSLSLSPSTSPSLGPGPSPGSRGHGVYCIGNDSVENYDGVGIGGSSDNAMDVDREADTSSEEPSGDAGENTDLSGLKDDEDGLFVADDDTDHEADDENNNDEDEDGSITSVSISVPRNGGGGGGGSYGGAAVMEMDFEDEERRARSGSRGSRRGTPDIQMSFDFHECVDFTSEEDDGDDATDSASVATPLIDLTEPNNENNGSGISRSPSGPGSVTRESLLFVGDTLSVSARSGSQTPGNRVSGSPFGHSNGAPGSSHGQDSGGSGSPYTNRPMSRWSIPRTPRARIGHQPMMPPPSRSVREESSLFVSPSTHPHGAREESMRLGTPNISARDVREESSLFVTPSRFERESAGPSERAMWFISPSARDHSARLSRADDSASVFFDDSASAGNGEKRRSSESGGSEPDRENPKRARNM